MYRMYKTKCVEEGKEYAKQNIYETIFNTEFNLGFFVPKNDLCQTCETFKNLIEEEKILQKVSYQRHLNEKELCRTEKQNDINTADGNAEIICVDLQAVIPLPSGDDCSFFYKRRLNCYNFTIFNIVRKEGHCYLWHEALGKGGANEIGTCLFEFFKTQTAKKIIMYSDNCARQQKNKFVASLLLHTVNTSQYVEEILHKFFLVGHSQNEGDAMHALIEKKKKVS